jgi:hypothetical protein
MTQAIFTLSPCHRVTLSFNYHPSSFSSQVPSRILSIEEERVHSPGQRMRFPGENGQGADRHVFRFAYFNREVLSMAAPRLRVFPHSKESAYQTCQEPEIRVSLRDLLPLIALAKRQKYLWLDDFLEDEVRITSDLYDVLRAFNHCRPSA